MDTKRYPPRAVRARISDAKNQLIDARDLPGAGQRPVRGHGRAGLSPLRAPHARGQLDGLRRPADAHRQRARAVRGRSPPLPRALPLDPRRRVPGHEPRPVPAAAAARRGGREPDRRRRRGPVDLRLPRGRGPQHPRVHDRLQGCARRQARAELPLDGDDSRGRQRGDLAQHGPARQEPLVRPRRGREDPRRRTRGRARRGPLRRRRDRGADRPARDEPRRDRGLLPDQRPQPGAGGHPGPLRAALPGDRRDEVLRARRDQGRHRLPAADGQSGRRGELLPRDQLAAPRDRRHQPGPPAQPRQHDRPDDLGDRARARGGTGAGRRGDPLRSPGSPS